MHNGGQDHGHDKVDDYSRLAREPPDIELKWMCFKAAQISLMEELHLSFFILDAVPVLKGQMMHRASTTDSIIGRIRAPPYLLDHVISELRL